MSNPAGEKLAWDFVLAHWDAVQKAGGVFASAEVCRRNQTRSAMRICAIRSWTFSLPTRSKAAERTYRQSIERINNCIDLKSQQEPQFASWLGQHGTSAGGQ
jgi:hypothetical protein